MEQSYDGCPWNWQKPPMYCIFMSSHLFSNSSKIWIPISIPTNAQQKPDMSHYFSIRHRNPHISYTLHHKLHHWNKRGQWKTAKWRVESRIWMFTLQCHSSYCPWFSAAEIDHSHVEWSYVPYGVLTIAELNMWAGSLCIKGPSINALHAHVYIYNQQLFLGTTTCHIQYTFLSLCQCFHKKTDKTRKCVCTPFSWYKNGSQQLLGMQSINTERASSSETKSNERASLDSSSSSLDFIL